MGNIQWFTLVYIIGAYIKKYNIELNKTKHLCLLYPLVVIAVYVVAELLGYSKSLDLIKKITSMNSIIVLIESIIIFIFFKNINIKNSNLINIAGKSSLGVYFIHDNYMIRNVWWNKILNVKYFYNINILVLILHIIVSIIIIYSFGIIAEVIRIKMIENNIFKLKILNTLCKKYDSGT